MSAAGCGLGPRVCPECWGYRVNRKGQGACNKRIKALSSDTGSPRPLKEVSMIVAESGGGRQHPIDWSGEPL